MNESVSTKRIPEYTIWLNKLLSLNLKACEPDRRTKGLGEKEMRRWLKRTSCGSRIGYIFSSFLDYLEYLQQVSFFLCSIFFPFLKEDLRYFVFH